MEDFIVDLKDRDSSLDYFEEKNKDNGILSPEYLFKLENEKWYFKYREKMILEILNLYFNKQKTVDVTKLDCVDVGVGTGKLSKAIGGIFPLMTRYDVSKKYCNFAKSNFDLDVHLGDLPYDINLKQHDVIFLLDVLEYLLVPGLSLETLYSHIKEDGYLIISTLFHPFLYSQINKENGMTRRYRKPGLSKLLELHGFEIEYFSYLDYEIFKTAILTNLTSTGWVYPLTKLQSEKIEKLKYQKALFDLLKLQNDVKLPMGRGGIFICKKKKFFKPENNIEALETYEDYLMSGDETNLLKWGVLEKIASKYFKLEEEKLDGGDVSDE